VKKVGQPASKPLESFWADLSGGPSQGIDLT
jgi:hypothetical protein